jgi:hypothetical protein
MEMVQTLEVMSEKLEVYILEEMMHTDISLSCIIFFIFPGIYLQMDAKGLICQCDSLL